MIRMLAPLLITTVNLSKLLCYPIPSDLMFITVIIFLKVFCWQLCLLNLFPKKLSEIEKVSLGPTGGEASSKIPSTPLSRGHPWYFHIMFLSLFSPQLKRKY